MAGNIDHAAFAFDEKVIVVRRIGIEIGLGAVYREFANETCALKLMQRIIHRRERNPLPGGGNFLVQHLRRDMAVAAGEQQLSDGNPLPRRAQVG